MVDKPVIVWEEMAVPGGIPRGVPGDLNITTPAPGRQFNCTEDMKVITSLFDVARKCMCFT